jgi:hypothetical protein
MKKVFLLFIVSFLAISVSRAQTNWVKYKVDGKLSISVPSQPVEVTRGLMSQTKDGLICLIGNIQATDSVQLNKMIVNGDFANSLKTTMLGDMKGVSFGNVKPGKWHGHYCFSVDGENYNNNLMAYFFYVIIGRYVYTFGCMFPEGQSEKNKDYFFNSLTLNFPNG